MHMNEVAKQKTNLINQTNVRIQRTGNQYKYIFLRFNCFFIVLLKKESC